MGRIPDFDQGDIQLAFTIDGVKGTVFPNRNSGYVGKNVTCEKGVTAVWNNDLWGVVHVNSNGNTKVTCNVEFQIASNINEAKIGDYVSYTPSQTNFEISKSDTGYEDQIINPSELNLWRIIKKNDDGTIEMISENTSSNAVTLYSQTGYDGYVRILKRLATSYETSGITAGSRYMGYEEEENGKLYENDIKLVQEACNSLKSSSGYYIGSREYSVTDNPGGMEYYYYVRIVDSDGDVTTAPIYNYAYGQFSDLTVSNFLRPIVILKSGITSISGNGSKDNPWKVN